MRGHRRQQPTLHRHLLATHRVAPGAGLQKTRHLDVRRRIALVEQHQRRLAGARMLIDPQKCRVIPA